MTFSKQQLQNNTEISNRNSKTAGIEGKPSIGIYISIYLLLDSDQY